MREEEGWGEIVRSSTEVVLVTESSSIRTSSGAGKDTLYRDRRCIF